MQVCNHISKENRTRTNAICNETKKVVARAMRIKAEKEIEAFSETPTFQFSKNDKKRKRCPRRKIHSRH